MELIESRKGRGGAGGEGGVVLGAARAQAEGSPDGAAVGDSERRCGQRHAVQVDDGDEVVAGEVVVEARDTAVEAGDGDRVRRRRAADDVGKARAGQGIASAVSFAATD